jgi:hypothetical protein
MKVSKTLYCVAIIVLLPVVAISAYGDSLSADEIVHKMDEHRLIGNDFEMTIRVDSYTHNQFDNSTVMKGFVSNGRLTTLAFLEPLNMKGRKIIMKGNDMWFIVPNVKNPIRITASQRLMGGISYGDIAGISYEEGYSAKFNGEEATAGMNSDGTKSDDKQCFIVELTAKAAGTATKYNKILIWVEQRNFLPLKADFFALSGKKMMTAYYTSPQEWNGKAIITKMFLFDQINLTKHFSMEYSDIKIGATDNSANPDN